MSLSSKERRKLLGNVSARFLSRKDNYRRGVWSLSEEIGAVPSQLWASFILDMASNKQLASWKVVACAKYERFLSVTERTDYLLMTWTSLRRGLFPLRKAVITSQGVTSCSSYVL